MTVTGVHDFVDAGDIGYSIITGAAGSTDGNDSGMTVADVSVLFTDIVSAGITVTPTSGLTTTEAGGPATDMLIRDRKLGAALARSLGPASFALMRGHGAVAVGGTLKQAVYRAIYAEANARLQSEAMRLGTVNYLNDQEAANAARTIDGVIERPWELWKKRVEE